MILSVSKQWQAFEHLWCKALYLSSPLPFEESGIGLSEEILTRFRNNAGWLVMLKTRYHPSLDEEIGYKSHRIGPYSNRRAIVEGEHSKTPGYLNRGIIFYDTGPFYFGTYRYLDALFSGAHGTGTKIFRSGERYDGQFVDDHCEGTGRYTWSTGSVYAGEFANNFRNGAGRTTIVGVGVHEGMYFDGEYHGMGTLSYLDGNVYAGGFRHNEYYGMGKLVYSNGDVYTGKWKDGKPEGQGVWNFN